MMTNNHNTTFLLDKKVVLVKPSKPTSSEVLSPSSIDNNHFLLSFFAKPGQEEPPLVIGEALSKVLVYYYPLAGKLKRNRDGNLQINCTADGVPFLVANANCKLSSLHYLGGVDVEVAKQFVFDFPSERDLGSAQFFQALAELASGKSEPTVKPVWERERLVVTPTEEPLQFLVDNSSLAISPYMPTTDLLHECFHMGKPQFCLTMGIRKRLNPPLPVGYYGNAFVTTTVLLMGGELNEIPLSKVVKLIKESKKVASNSDYIMHSVRVSERLRQQNINFDASGYINGFSRLEATWFAGRSRL
uniref:Uncharacterized protein n=1 Tax=Fagus sylvatica TaxID=28930 RepID=A0A2N9FW51_FAGSY